jgi:hypothetical protein
MTLTPFVTAQAGTAVSAAIAAAAMDVVAKTRIVPPDCEKISGNQPHMNSHVDSLN